MQWSGCARRLLGTLGLIVVQLQVTGLLHIRGQGTVLTGIVTGGDISIGKRLDIHSPNASVTFTVAGIERDRESLTKAKSGDSIAVLARNLDLAKVSDGFRVIEGGGYEIKSLILVEPSRKWWEFWK